MSRRPEVLDLTGTDMPKALRLLDDAFQQLGVDAGLELVADEALDELRAHLDATQPEEHEWWELETPGGRRRALVARRATNAAPIRLMGYFCADHRGLRTRLDEARAAVEAGDRQEAARALHALETGLVSHWRAEEELLFPLLSAADPVHGPEAVARLRQEHLDFARRLNEMGELLGGEERFDQPRLDKALEEFWQATVDHEGREENAVHPLREYAAAQSAGDD